MIDLASHFAKCRILVGLLTNARLGLHNPSGECRWENREPLLDKQLHLSHVASDQITCLHCCLWVISLVQNSWKKVKNKSKQPNSNLNQSRPVKRKSAEVVGLCQSHMRDV